MIEVLNIFPINKNSLVATCDVHIIPWKLTLKEVKIFEKGANRWIGLPAREHVNEAGEKKYIELIAFDSESVKVSFRNQIMGAIDKYMAENPELKLEDAIKSTEDFPF